jgi:hypothetical protein
MSQNLTKSQKNALKKIPKGVHNESALISLGVSKSQLLSLASKSALLRKMESGNIVYQRQ